MDENETRTYITTKIHPIFERLLMDLVMHRPDDPIPFMTKWLQTTGQSHRPPKAMNTQQSPEKDILKQLPANVEVVQVSSEEEAQEDNDEVPDMQMPPQLSDSKKSAARASVSAEVFGQFNQKPIYVPKVIPKNKDQKARIQKKVGQAFMFSALDEADKDIVINAMEERKFKANDWVIKQGEDGDHLYVVDQGLLDCYKKAQHDNQFLKTYQPGESFGELALLYNVQRAASIQAKTECVLWSLDRDTFNHIVRDAATRKREKYEEILKQVDILTTIDGYERMQIADALKIIESKAGTTVIQQGDKGDMFYIVQTGTLKVYKSDKNQPPVEVHSYKDNDYFGELALLKDQPRQATVKCETDCILLGLDRQSFKRLLGPIDELLKRNAEKYQKYNQS